MSSSSGDTYEGRNAVNAPEPPDGYGYCLGGRILLACEKCGAVVCDTTLHTSFHVELSGATEAGLRKMARRAEGAALVEQIRREQGGW